MKLVATLIFVNVFGATALASGADPVAPAAHPVAPVLQLRPRAAAPATLPPNEAPSEAGPATREHWYGWQSLSTDGVALLMSIVAASASDQKGNASEVLGYGGLAVYLLGGPVTHFAHQSPGRGFGSLALRVGLPLSLGAIGYKLENCSGDNDFDLCGFGGALLGGLLGIVSAVAVDAAVLGYEEVPVEPARLPIVSISVGHEQALLVAGGRF